MSITPSYFRRTALIAVLALILQVLLPLLQPAMAAEAMTGQGMRHCSMPSQTTNNQNHSKAQQSKSLACPICMAMHLHSGGFIPPHDVILAFIEHAAIPVIPPQTAAPISPHYPTDAQPRAPPALT